MHLFTDTHTHTAVLGNVVCSSGLGDGKKGVVGFVSWTGMPFQLASSTSETFTAYGLDILLDGL